MSRAEKAEGAAVVFNGDGELKKMRVESADGRSKQERGGPRRLQAGERETTKDRDAGTGERKVKNKAGARESQTGSRGAGSLRNVKSKNPGSCGNPARGSQGHR